MQEITKKQLLECCDKDKEWGFNRALDRRFVEGLPDLIFPIISAMEGLHEHKQGRACEKHMRIVVALNEQGEIGVIDVPLDFYFTLAMM